MRSTGVESRSEADSVHSALRMKKGGTPPKYKLKRKRGGFHQRTQRTAFFRLPLRTVREQ